MMNGVGWARRILNYGACCTLAFYAVLLFVPSMVRGEALVVEATSSTSVELSWTAPGNNGNYGTAAQYDIRYSTSMITEWNWDRAIQLEGEPTPQPAGSRESFVVTGLNGNTTYYFAIKTADEVPNWSGLSNVAITTDIERPGAIDDLTTATGDGVGELVLSWSATGDDGYVGTADHYLIVYDTKKITAVNWEDATMWFNPPAPLPAGYFQIFTMTNLDPGTEYWVAMKVWDEVGNVSELSNIAHGFARPSITIDIFDEESGDVPTAFRLSQNYPNPFNASTIIEYAVSTATHVTISIYNILGAHTSTIIDRAMPAGDHTVIWDGTDSRGRQVASGIYLYYIQAGDFTARKKMILLQ